MSGSGGSGSTLSLSPPSRAHSPDPGLDPPLCPAQASLWTRRSPSVPPACRSSALPSALRGRRASQQRSAPRPHHREACAGRPERPSPPGLCGHRDAGSSRSRAGRSQDESVAAESATHLQNRMEKWEMSRRFLCLVHIDSLTSPRRTLVMAGHQDGEVPSPMAGHTWV